MAFGAVCISSEDGALAEDASRRVAERLGFRLIDEEIVMRAAIDAGVEEEAVADVERRKSMLARLLDGLGPAGMASGAVMLAPEPGYGSSASGELRGLITSAIQETAASGNVVIVAHAASLALGSREDVLRVLITASPQTRRSRLSESLDVDEKEAERRMKRSDANRADYIKRFYGIAAEQPTHYDLVINTDKLGAEDAARLVVDAVNGPA